MNTIETGPSNNAHDSEVRSRSWTHFRVDRRSPRYCPVTFDHPPINTITALLVIDPYNEFISAGPPSIDNHRPDQDRERPLSSLTPESSARTKPLAQRTLRVYKSQRRWSLERVTVARYDDVNMDSDVRSISMSINNGLLAQLLSIQQLPTQSRFKSHSFTRPPQTPAASS